jgi:hypothetical protein
MKSGDQIRPVDVADIRDRTCHDDHKDENILKSVQRERDKRCRVERTGAPELR